MDNCLSSHHGSFPFLPSRHRNSLNLRVSDCVFLSSHQRKPRYDSMVMVVAASSASGASLDAAPLSPRSAQGRFLNSVLVNKRQLFHFAVADLLKQLADDKEAAFSRMFLSSGSDDASLHRRIAQLKENHCQTAIEDIMYMLILYKFSEIKVPLIPKLSTCIYNGKLEIWPSKYWELESIHNYYDVLELIKEHTNTVISLRLNSSSSLTTTEIKKQHLSKVYAASILYGYFLKSASLRHQLESSLSGGRLITKQLRSYISGFDPKILQRCAKPRSSEAKNLIEKQRLALFGSEEEEDGIVTTTFCSVKRLLLEAVAFGSFLWDTEEYVDGAFKLKENENAEEEENSSV